MTSEFIFDYAAGVSQDIDHIELSNNRVQLWVVLSKPKELKLILLL